MRYLRLFLVQLRASLQLMLQYRAEFFFGLFMQLFWLFWNLAPLFVIWGHRPRIAGWTLPEALLVAAWFTFLRALLDGAIEPSLIATVEHIRKGTLDFVLLKPADAQFLVSTAKFDLLSIADALAALGLGAWALRRLHHVPTAAQLGLALLLTCAGAALLYSLAILVIAAAFYVVRLDNLIYLFNSVFDAGRWPASIFRGAWRWLFTFVIPLALMTTYPALALLGRLEPRVGMGALFGALAFLLLSRLVWRRAIGHYRSASS